MNIAHLKNSRLSYAPDYLVKCLNKYSDGVINVYFCGPPDQSNADCLTNFSLTEDIKNNLDIVHFHASNYNTWGINNIKNPIIQYHHFGPPWGGPEYNNLNPPKNYKKLVIAQKHMILPEYKDCLPVRNIIDIYDEPYSSWENNGTNNKIKVGYSPSVIIPTHFFNGIKENGKGYQETLSILQNIKNKYSEFMDFDIIHGVSLNECLKRKSVCDIVIDECKTLSFHRSGLEGLALGKTTICGISKELEEKLIEITKCKGQPFINCTLENLENKLIELIHNKDYLKQKGLESRFWMEKYWNPKDIIKDFINIYNNML